MHAGTAHRRAAWGVGQAALSAGMDPQAGRRWSVVQPLVPVRAEPPPQADVDGSVVVQSDRPPVTTVAPNWTIC